MKNLFLLATALLHGFMAFSQGTIPVLDTPYYQDLKANGQLNGSNIASEAAVYPGTPGAVFGPGQNEVEPMSGLCGCYVEPDATWSTLQACDDCNSPQISLPFNFCLYGSSYNSIYINSNGNVSFSTPYTTFTPVAFPNASFIMVAPFWADIDTRGGLGEIRYKITPTAIYVNWVNVGYYSMMGDKRNTFSLILTNGNDSVIGIGNNVAFCYKDMQWTTGSASGGSGGFGGSPAIVGANWGNGVNFNMIGRFNGPGTTYFGPNATNNQVSWLDFKKFKFNVCNVVNVPPVLVTANVPGYNFVMDTCNAYSGGTLVPNPGYGGICEGTTVTGNLTFTGPEQNQTVTITGNGPPGATFSSTPGGTSTINFSYTPPIGTSGPQTFTITATDNGNPVQSTTVTFSINVNSAPYYPTIVGPDSICPGSTATLNVPQFFDTYLWYGAANGNAPTITGPEGLYYLAVTINGCTLTTNKTVQLYTPPVPVISGNNIVCPGSTTPLSTTIPYNAYVWSNGDTLATTNAGLGSHTVTVTDHNTCTGTSAPFAITEYPQFTPVNTVTDVSCFGLSDGSIVVSIPGATGNETISWNHDPNLTSFTASGLSAATYVYQFTDPNGCVWTDSASVNEPNPLSNTLTITDVTCPGGNDGAVQVNSSGGTAPYTYTWSNNPNNTSSLENGFSLGNYSVTISDANGCSENLNFSLSEMSTTPTLSFTSIIESCPNAANGSIDLTVSGGTPAFTYLWSNGDLNEDPQNLGQGNYSVTVTDLNGCNFTGSTSVGVGANILLTTQSNDILCHGDASGSILFNPQTGTAPFTVLLNGNNGSLNNQNLTAGTYNIQITDLNGCLFQDTITLVQPTPLIIDQVVYTINLGDVISIPIGALGGVPPYVYNWIPATDLSCTNCTQPLCTAVNTTNYTIEVTDNHGCISLGHALVNVNAMPPLIPNSFTPNGDELNDEWLVKLSGIEEVSIQIFDRWGSKIFETTDIYTPWTGKLPNGNPAYAGTYVYRIQGRLINGSDLNEFGHINLIR